ncbi:unnamed protein product [Urochloa humidicola]
MSQAPQPPGGFRLFRRAVDEATGSTRGLATSRSGRPYPPLLSAALKQAAADRAARARERALLQRRRIPPASVAKPEPAAVLPLPSPASAKKPGGAPVRAYHESQNDSAAGHGVLAASARASAFCGGRSFTRLLSVAFEQAAGDRVAGAGNASGPKTGPAAEGCAPLPASPWAQLSAQSILSAATAGALPNAGLAKISEDQVLSVAAAGALPNAGLAKISEDQVLSAAAAGALPNAGLAKISEDQVLSAAAAGALPNPGLAEIPQDCNSSAYLDADPASKLLVDNFLNDIFGLPPPKDSFVPPPPPPRTCPSPPTLRVHTVHNVEEAETALQAWNSRGKNGVLVRIPEGLSGMQLEQIWEVLQYAGLNIFEEPRKVADRLWASRKLLSQ